MINWCPISVSVSASSAVTYLDSIIAHHRARAHGDVRDIQQLCAQAKARRQVHAQPAQIFSQALARRSTLAVIAEVKRRSPSKGDIAIGLDPTELVGDYVAGGACCVSVLTDTPHFGGSAEDLMAVRATTSLPILRKDFTVSVRDVYDAGIMGADAVLLIVAALPDHELHAFHQAAGDVGLDVLMEVHDELEVERALAVGATLIGVNQRDLHTFAVDGDRAVRVARAIPTGVIAVAESGIAGPDDARRCADAGYKAVLVGEHLVRSGDRVKALRDLQVVLPS